MTASVVGYMMRTALHSRRNLQETTQSRSEVYNTQSLDQEVTCG